MSVKVQMFFEVDLPTSVEMALDATYETKPEVAQVMFLTGKGLGKACPQIFHWLVRNGMLDQELMVSVGAQKNEEVDQSVEQPSPV